MDQGTSGNPHLQTHSVVQLESDSYTTSLVAGKPLAALGVNFNAFEQGQLGEEASARYLQWRHKAHSLLFEHGCHVYELPFVHITVGTPAPFTHNCVPSLQHVAAVERAWSRALWKRLRRGEPRWPTKPFVVTAQSMRLDKRAGIILWRAENDAIDQIRAVLHSVDEDLRNNVEEDEAHEKDRRVAVEELKLRFGCPNIIHSTVVRFYKNPPESKFVEDKFYELANELLPLKVTCSELTFLREDRPYQHMEGKNIVERFPYKEFK